MEFDINSFIDSKRQLVVELESILTAIPALSPDSGGEGELKKCEALEHFLRKSGFTNIERFDVPDSRAAGGVRPNLVLTLESGAAEDSGGALWFISHLDVVPPGETKLWLTNPWEAVEKDGKLFGRGVEDNQQGLVSSVLAALALKSCGIKPRRTLKLLFAADEECASVYGMAELVKLRGKNGMSLFCKKDAALIPDGGDSLGKGIEIAEKHLLWLKITTLGRQTHGSRPDNGKNAFLAGCAMALELHTALHAQFNGRDSLFEPDYSTFEPSKKEANVPNINTIPGEDVFYMDMRILPRYSVAEVLAFTRRVADKIELEHGVSVRLETVQSVESPPTQADAPLVRSLATAIEAVLGVKARPFGIGGGTVAAFLRKLGIDAVVWSKLDDTAHNPNEYAIIGNILAGAKVMARLAVEF